MPQGICNTASFAACLLSASAAVITRQSSTASIEFCTASVYATGACPYAQPTSGTGTCGNFTVAANVCCKYRERESSFEVLKYWLTIRTTIDTFDDFPYAPSALINNVDYIDIPAGAITGCNLYK